MKEKKKIPMLPHDWNKQLQEACGVSATLVTHAVRYNVRGKKADDVRAKFEELFLND